MARQRPTRLVMGPCIAEIDRIVIREVQNEEVIVKGNFGWVWSMWAGPQVEIDRIVIREVQYQFDVNRCRNEEIIVKGNFGWVWSMWAGRTRIDCIVIREVQYQFEVNRCRNEEIIVKAILGGCGLVMGPCIVEIDPNVIREVQYQFEVNPCRNEKNIVNEIFWWVWAYVGGRPMIDPNVITKVQYQFEVNPLNGNFWWVWPMWAGRPRIDRIVIREVQYQFEVNRCRNKEVNFQGSRRTDRRTDGRTAEITTISPPFFQKANCYIKPDLRNLNCQYLWVQKKHKPSRHDESSPTALEDGFLLNEDESITEN
ncbi:hypothetical protein DPMN_048584 [Dreissena polymorpha]|uniref:Uncharacterized protein n=1 Tax=Dreissena polymorpha TaxID=45954 RepID=A0A9D4DBX8_DREPO|nr:hypothetical protein DPMN_048584 [Dreissena polymorpha]